MTSKRKKAVLKLKDKLEDLRLELDTIKDEEQSAFDNLPQSKAEELEDVFCERIDTLQDIVDGLEGYCEQLGEIVEEN